MLNLDHFYPRTPAIIAHRGASAIAPENTLAAFERAVALGADAVELDVKLSKDGVPIIIHDSTLDRTTDGKGNVSGFTLADLKSLDAGAKKSAQFAGERVPTLAEVFEAVAHKIWVNVELTNYTTRGDGLEAAVVALVHKMNLGGRILFSSFSPLAIRKVKKIDPMLTTAVLTSPDMPFFLRNVWLTPIVPHEARHPELLQLKERGVNSCQKRGYRVNVWTVNDPDDIRLMATQGVDGIITDVPDIARRAAFGG